MKVLTIYSLISLIFIGVTAVTVSEENPLRGGVTDRRLQVDTEEASKIDDGMAKEIASALGKAGTIDSSSMVALDEQQLNSEGTAKSKAEARNLGTTTALKSSGRRSRGLSPRQGCMDDTTFEFVYTNKRGKSKIKGGCEFVARKRKRRCRKKMNGVRVRDSCPLTCGRCDPQHVIRWASTGGGHRAQFATAGYARVLHDLGILEDVSGMSFESGSSWFSTQFFYSQEYHDAIIDSTPKELHDFVINWTDASYTIWDPNAEGEQCYLNKTQCENLGGGDLCVFATSLLCFDFAQMIYQMMKAASKGYGDPGFENRQMKLDNRVERMKDTNHYVQAVLHPMSRVKYSNGTAIGVFLGPKENNDDGDVFALPITMIYGVSNGATYYDSTYPSTDVGLDFDNFQCSASKIGDIDSLNDLALENYPLFSNVGNSKLIRPGVSVSATGTLSPPFGGSEPSVSNVAAISAAALGHISTNAPSSLKQALSVPIIAAEYNLTEEDNQSYFYQNGLTDFMSICSQWKPRTQWLTYDVQCKDTDARFYDGGWSDAPTLAMNIGQYHSRENGSLDVPMKVLVVCNGASNSKFLAYFNNSEINDGIEPGAIIWPKFEDANFSNGEYVLPEMSTQVFENKLERAELENKTVYVSDLQNIKWKNPNDKPEAVVPFSTFVIRDLITIDNPAFNVKAGQKVDVLYLTTNSHVPIGVVGDEDLATMTKAIVLSNDLKKVMQEFFSE